MASPLLDDDVAEPRKASATFAATVRDVLERRAHQCCNDRDHVEPHKGDQQKFFFGELQSLCKLHHEGAKKREDARGYSTQIGADGWPVDPRHPVYSRDREGHENIRGTGGHEIFLRLPSMQRASAPRFCYNFIA